MLSNHTSVVLILANGYLSGTTTNIYTHPTKNAFLVNIVGADLIIRNNCFDNNTLITQNGAPILVQGPLTQIVVEGNYVGTTFGSPKCGFFLRDAGNMMGEDECFEADAEVCQASTTDPIVPITASPTASITAAPEGEGTASPTATPTSGSMPNVSPSFLAIIFIVSTFLLY